MDRRDFVKGLMGSGALGVVPLATFAGVPHGDPRDAMPVVVVSQSDVPPAAALARSIAGSLDAAGAAALHVAARGDDLGSSAGVSAILDRAGRARVVGVMDDAAALVFQHIAAARGAGWLMRGHHRIAGDTARHCCNVAGMETDVVWADASAAHVQRIARLYVQAVAHRRAVPEAGVAAAGATAVGADRPASLATFAITT